MMTGNSTLKRKATNAHRRSEHVRKQKHLSRKTSSSNSGPKRTKKIAEFSNRGYSDSEEEDEHRCEEDEEEEGQESDSEEDDEEDDEEEQNLTSGKTNSNSIRSFDSDGNVMNELVSFVLAHRQVPFPKISHFSTIKF